MSGGLIIKDAEEMKFTLAGTDIGTEEIVPSVHFKTCGWMCNTNSTANPWRSELIDDVSAFLEVSGETLYHFADSLSKDSTRFGFGENALR